MDLGTIGRKFRKIGRDTVTEVQKMNDIRQINSKINEQKKQISTIYSQIGQKLYKLYKEAPLEGFDTEFQKIDERFATIEVYNDQIREIKGVRMCPNCHTEVSIHERYCSACGQKLPEIIHIQTDENGNTVIEGPNAEVIDLPEQENPKMEAAKAVKAEEPEIVKEEPEPEETAPEEPEEPEVVEGVPESGETAPEEPEEPEIVEEGPEPGEPAPEEPEEPEIVEEGPESEEPAPEELEEPEIVEEEPEPEEADTEEPEEAAAAESETAEDAKQP